MATAYNRVDQIDPADLGAANDDGYRPSPDEPFMNPRQQEYFRAKLLAWKDAILRESQGTLSQLQVDSLREADLNDLARDRLVDRAAYARSPAQTDRQDRGGAAPDR